MARKITLEQLEQRLVTALAKELKNHEGTVGKHVVLRILVLQKASNAMALKIAVAHFGEKPKIRMPDVRWNRNRALEDDSLKDVLDHGQADAHEKSLTGTNLDPSPEGRGATPRQPPSDGTSTATTGNTGAGGPDASTTATAAGGKARDVDPSDIEF